MSRSAKTRRVGIRELKARLSEVIREVKAGATVMITEHGRGVARLVPEGASLEERIEGLRRSGEVLWSGRRLAPRLPGERIRGRRRLSDLVVENRE
jgi:prevent-host-death family protein